jgi:hypothetical protein
VTSAQTAFAILTGVFVTAGAILLDRGEVGAGWLLLGLSATAFVMLGAMIIISAFAARARTQP